MNKKFKHLEVIIFNLDVKKHPLKKGEHVLFLGNIPNAPGHCAVAKKDGEVIWLVHPEDFRKAKQEEL